MSTTKNATQFALLSGLLHWLMAALLPAMLLIGVSMAASLGSYHALVAIPRGACCAAPFLPLHGVHATAFAAPVTVSERPHRCIMH